MDYGTFDFETPLIQPSVQVPSPVCLVTDVSGHDELLHCRFDREAVGDRLYRLFTERLVVGAYTAFDACAALVAMPELSEAVWTAYDQFRVLDVLLNEQLIDLAKGRLGWMYAPGQKPQKVIYNLANVVQRRFGVDISGTKEGPDAWRLRYGTLAETPISQWEPAAVKYPLDDLGWTRAALHDQLKEPPELLVDAARQARASFWLTLVSARGFALDRNWIERLEADLLTEQKRLVEGDAAEQASVYGQYLLATRTGDTAAIEAAQRAGDRARGLAAHGLVVTTKKGALKKETKAAGARLAAVWGNRPRPEPVEGEETEESDEDGEDDAVPTTPDGAIQLTKEVCRDSGDLVLKDYSKYCEVVTTLAKVSALKDAALAGMPIQARFETILETGRTSCRGGKVKKKDIPNRSSYGFQIQNVKTEPGLRECFTPRPGYLLWSIDYGQLELCTWAQACMYLFGFSKMAEMLNAKQDVHSMMGAMIFGLEYDWVVANKKKDPKAKKARDCGKPFIFGKPGGMGDTGIQHFAAGPKYNVILTLEEAHTYSEKWKQLFPENVPYFKYIRHCVERQGYVVQLVSNRIRGTKKFTEASNGTFQALAADTAKDAVYEVERACYTGRDSEGNRYPALHGSYVVDFVHDEAIGESPIDRASEAVVEASSIMKRVAHKWLPHVPPDAEPCLMQRWFKEAALERGEDGRIKAWKPKTKDVNI